MGKKRHVVIAVVAIMLMAMLAVAQSRKEYRYTVGQHAMISIVNQYGPISVVPGLGNQVVVRAALESDKVEIDQDQRGSRIDIVSHLLSGSNDQNGRVEYEVQVPSYASVSLRSPTGPLRVERLSGDVSLEGEQAHVEVRDITHAHVHVRTLTGPIVLTNIRAGHVEITSLGGEVTLNDVSGPFVQVNSTSGRIHYDGDFGLAGEYSLTSHTGDIDAIAPSNASIDVTARSMHGKVENDFPLQPKTHSSMILDSARSFVGTAGKAASKVVLHSISGKICLKTR